MRFASPVILHLENYLGFPVGERVPVGRYDALIGAWKPENDGRVIAIVSETAGLADIDVDGNGAADPPAALAALGIQSSASVIVGAPRISRAKRSRRAALAEES